MQVFLGLAGCSRRTSALLADTDIMLGWRHSLAKMTYCEAVVVQPLVAAAFAFALTVIIALLEEGAIHSLRFLRASSKRYR